VFATSIDPCELGHRGRHPRTGSSPRPDLTTNSPPILHRPKVFTIIGRVHGTSSRPRNVPLKSRLPRTRCLPLIQSNAPRSAYVA
jgi:hypothetical protein